MYLQPPDRDKCSLIDLLEQGIILTGSRHDAYATDEWNLKLRELIRTAHSRQQRILGHCFGCQITTIVLGGTVGGLLFRIRFLKQQFLQTLQGVRCPPLDAVSIRCPWCGTLQRRRQLGTRAVRAKYTQHQTLTKCGMQVGTWP